MYKVDINFEESSKEWRKNKVVLGNGTFRYRCAHFSLKKQQYCKNHLVYQSPYCRIHIKRSIS